MDTNTVSDSIILSPEVMAAAFDIADSGIFFKEEDGKKTLIDQKEVNSILLKSLGTKTEKLIEERVTKATKEAESKTKRLVSLDFEKQVKETFGIDGYRLSDGVTPIQEWHNKSKGTTIDVEKSPKFLSVVDEYEQRIKEKDEAHALELQKRDRQSVQRDVKSYLVDLYSKEDSKLSIKGKTYLDTHAELVIKDAENEGSFYAIRDKKLVVLDEDGQVKRDKSNGHQPINAEVHALNTVKSRYNPELVGKDISSPNPLKDNPLKEVKTDKGTVQIPDFETAEEGLAFMDKAEREGLGYEVIDAANQKIAALSDN